MTKCEFFDILRQCEPPFVLSKRWLCGEYHVISLRTATEHPPRQTIKGNMWGSLWTHRVTICTLRNVYAAIPKGLSLDGLFAYTGRLENATAVFVCRLDATLAKYQRWLDEYMSSSGSEKE